MAARVKLNLAGIRELKRDPGVAAEIERRGNMILAAAKSSAPEKPTGYRDGLKLEMDEHPIAGAVAHIHGTGSDAFYVEAKTGNLARSLDAARGA